MVFAIVAGERQAPGWPDRLVYHVRWQGLLEFKGASTRITALQKIKIRELRRRGQCYVVRYPNIIEDEVGNVIAYFDGSGAGLLATLAGFVAPRVEGTREGV